MGDEVVIQCPFSKEWKKKGIIEKARFINGGQGARSYEVRGHDGQLYLRNFRYLTNPIVIEG